MEDHKGLVVIKILSEIQEKYEVNNLVIKDILERNLEEYSLLSNSYEIMVSDLTEKIMFFLGIKQLEGLSKQSIQRYKDELNMFSRYITKPVSQITINDIRKYFAIIQMEKKYEKITMNGKMAVLRSFFGTLYKEEIIEKDPTIRLKNIKVDVKSLREHLTVEELEILRNACINIREKALVEFLYSTGCRVSEILDINIQNINWNSNSLVVHGKGDKYRTVYFSVKCKLYIKEYIASRAGESDILFIGERNPYIPLKKSGVEKLIKKIGKRTTLKKEIYPHIFRHSMATHALQKGMDITIIQQLLGHEQINTTQIYAKNSDKQLQIAYEKFIAA